MLTLKATQPHLYVVKMLWDRLYELVRNVYKLVRDTLYYWKTKQYLDFSRPLVFLRITSLLKLNIMFRSENQINPQYPSPVLIFQIFLPPILYPLKKNTNIKSIKIIPKQ